MAIQLEDNQVSRGSFKRRSLIAFFTIASLALIGFQIFSKFPWGPSIIELSKDLCPQGETLRPASFIKDNSSIEFIVKDPQYRAESVKKISGAVKIPTVSFDYNEDPLVNPEQWKNFTKFHWFLESQFPLVYQKLEVTKPNIYGLVFEWKGSDPNLKPLLLIAHQDVVPVAEETLSQWKYPPFEGVSDGKYVWGRGSSDCKALLVAELQSIERLIKDGFEPRRTVVLAFGFDEEIGGKWGASSNSKYLQDKYGENSFFALVDEGGSSISVIDDVAFALPSIGEKGATNLQITLNTPGGHSSVPPDHTNIGIISNLINDIESTPFEPLLTEKNPTLNFVQCVAKYSDEYDDDLKKSIFRATIDKVSNSKVVKFLSSIKGYKYTIRTTQAVDIIHGGVKSNALPEFTSLVLNHRIAVESSLKETIDKIIGNLKEIAIKFDLGLVYKDEEIIQKTQNGYFTLLGGEGLEPSPVSALDNKSWEVFSGTIKHIIEDYVYPNLTTPAVVAGNLGTGNTDTNRYWNLTNNIYRYKFSTLNGILDAHTHSINEHILIDDYIHLIAFTYEYIRNVDAAEDD
ncbi:Carboxypeptidase S [Wickerhamomyces ciferrii]|uniref:Carboxypeptidase S n=1 Tax=Wickerhamomyces ciferrii (strain ATCC 14091 / BCRC 22168 / CBS 111 / JCM 3599 / NBRC 0793 / NRRL Y-1031 F-60-10) TaxID=1206466 RepID=K0KVP2_WICCF|nr:Carboxypeptidase S [Wickerhamomyces ciferrii]CCH46022.1 Carboxypeptidase S [Wickerhamomyces ciferrii]